MNRTAFALVMCCAILTAILSASQVKAGKDTVVTAAQVNGTWKNGNNTFKVLALGKQRLKVSFYGLYKYNTPAGPSANEGEAEGIAFIEGDTAILKPGDAGSDDCVVTMVFGNEKLSVTEEGACPFGHNVTTAGTYRKVVGKK
jgi:hypothetical protein